MGKTGKKGCKKCGRDPKAADKRRCCQTDFCSTCIIKHFEEQHRPLGYD